ncbi:hypothetical protein GOP47_0001468 [Adiantum capillus-veneris]|uniref:Uncharacterized protein n=1 Tax=Adiantum capillus-veneris TaxID=13818 RepID=A0A9D4V940_ADICA|nr:hypothetical protein GOP47_0001468 [Adiantum capillus-veneris]
MAPEVANRARMNFNNLQRLQCSIFCIEIFTFAKLLVASSCEQLDERAICLLDRPKCGFLVKEFGAYMEGVYRMCIDFEWTAV